MISPTMSLESKLVYLCYCMSIFVNIHFCKRLYCTLCVHVVSFISLHFFVAVCFMSLNNMLCASYPQFVDISLSFSFFISDTDLFSSILHT